jgi:O-antigen/teichoic acid export membrane protein
VTTQSERQPDGTSLSSRVVRGTGLTAIGYFATQAATLAAYIVLARLASPTTFGTFAAGAILVTSGAFLAESGMTSALVQRRGSIDEAAATAIISTFFGGLSLAALSLCLSPIVGLFFHSREIGVIAAALSGVFFLHALAVVPRAVLQRSFSLRPVLVIEPLAAAALGVSAGVALAAGLGVWGLALGAYVSTIVRTSLMWLLASWRPRLSGASWALWRELAAFARHVVASEAVSNSSAIATSALIGRVLGPASLGQFRYGWRMALAGVGTTTAGAYILLPTLSRVAAERDRLARAYIRALRVSSLFLFPLSLFLVALGEPLAVILFGPPWAEAGQVLMALSGLVLVAGIGSITSELLKAAGRPDLLLRAHVIEAALSVVLVVVLVSFGPVAAAAGITVGTAVGTMYALVRGAGITGAQIRSVIEPMAAPAIAATLAAGCVLVLDRVMVDAGGRGGLAGLLLLALEAGVGVLVYLVVVIAISRAAARELRVVRDVVFPRFG